METKYLLYYRGICHKRPKEQPLNIAIRQAAQDFMKRTDCKDLVPTVAIVPVDEVGELGRVKTVDALDKNQNEIQLTVQTTTELNPHHLQVANLNGNGRN